MLMQTQQRGTMLHCVQARTNCWHAIEKIADFTPNERMITIITSMIIFNIVFRSIYVT